jgi:hypothetical protein
MFPLGYHCPWQALSCAASATRQPGAAALPCAGDWPKRRRRRQAALAPHRPRTAGRRSAAICARSAGAAVHHARRGRAEPGELAAADLAAHGPVGSGHPIWYDLPPAPARVRLAARRCRPGRPGHPAAARSRPPWRGPPVPPSLPGSWRGPASKVPRPVACSTRSRTRHGFRQAANQPAIAAPGIKAPTGRTASSPSGCPGSPSRSPAETTRRAADRCQAGGANRADGAGEPRLGATSESRVNCWA